MKYSSSTPKSSEIIFESYRTINLKNEEIRLEQHITNADVHALTGKYYHELTEEQQFDVYVHFCVGSSLELAYS